MSIILFVFSVILICLAHICRIYRWSLFIATYERPQFRNLTQALSLDYLLNLIFPYKLGDLFRIYFSGKEMKNKYALSFSSVVMDRYLDILFIGFIFVIIYQFHIGEGLLKKTADFYIFITVTLSVIPCLIYMFKRRFKMIFLNIAKIFNTKIETGLLTFIWACICNFKDMFININKIKLLFSTFLMWGLYFCSYYFYGQFLNSLSQGTSFIDILEMLFSQPNLMKAFNWTESTEILFLNLSYMVIPLIVLLVISLFLKNTKKNSVEEESFINMLPYMNTYDKLKFLENYFSNINTRTYIKNYLKVNRKISIIRDYSKGSKAATVLAFKDDTLFWRKYALNCDIDKLYDQIEWIEKYKDLLPLSDIIYKEKTALYCVYDMKYYSDAISFFDYIHTTPAENSWKILVSILDKLNNTLYLQHNEKANLKTISKYVKTKVSKNLETIKKSNIFKTLIRYDKLIINGQEYNNLPYYHKFLEEDFLKNIFIKDMYSVIHGDLTVENIVIRKDMEKDTFYLIDPNPDNIHNSPSLDMAKILQSLHGGYEFLVSINAVNIVDNKLSFVFKKSGVYDDLYTRLRKYMLDKFDKDTIKSIYFHEIVHWLRLMPYRMRKSRENAIVCYAQLLILLRDLENNFINSED